MNNEKCSRKCKRYAGRLIVNPVGSITNAHWLTAVEIGVVLMATGAVEVILTSQNVVGWSATVYIGQPHWIFPVDGIWQLDVSDEFKKTNGTLRKVLIAATNFSGLVAYHIWWVQILAILEYGCIYTRTRMGTLCSPSFFSLLFPSLSLSLSAAVASRGGWNRI